jgi:hypothetical protein
MRVRSVSRLALAAVSWLGLSTIGRAGDPSAADVGTPGTPNLGRTATSLPFPFQRLRAGQGDWAGRVPSLDVAPALAKFVEVSHGGFDRVQLAFVFFGCNRIGYSDWQKVMKTDPSSANVVQLRRTFADIVGLKPIPPLFFFTGDLVLNLQADQGQELRGQLDAWAQLYRSDPSGIARKTTLVPLPGNHEMLEFVQVGQASLEVPNPSTNQVWLDWLAANGFDRFAGNGPTTAPPNPDGLLNDQSKLTYSFDVGDVHFVTLNTDTYAAGDNTGWIAFNWVARDILRAQRNRRIRSIFVLGHKPIVAPVASIDNFDAILNPLAFQLYWLLNANSKVKAYLCAHAHEWDANLLGGPPGVWQIVAGNGGSPLDPGWDPPGGPYYGFTLVKVYQSGKVGIINYHRPAPVPYYAGPAPPAVPDREFFISRGGR